jgi:O-antigen/teichoic acid export membrane protein
MPSINAYLRKAWYHKTARNASWMLVGQGGNFLLQAGYFILLARLLGVNEYGAFAGAFALVNIISPYSALGGGMLFMRYVIADRSKAGLYWGNAVLTTSLLSLAIAIALYFAGPGITGVHSPLMFVALTIGNCLFAQISAMASQVFQAYEKLKLTAAVSFSSNLARFLVLVVMFVTLHRATAFQWSIGVLVASGIAAALSLWWVRRDVGNSRYSWSVIRKRIGEGFGFSFAGTTQAVYTDIDKTMLTHYGLDRENGFYTLAYRIIDFASTPVIALDLAIIPKYFALTKLRFPEVVKLAIKVTRTSVLMGIGIAICTLLIAPVVPHLVGKDFSGVLVALQWLCWIPLFRGIHRSMGSALTGTGFQHLRTGAQFTVAGVNLVLNLWWIPKFGWIGAAWSSFASDGMLACLNTALLLWISSRTEHRTAIPTVDDRGESGAPEQRICNHRDIPPAATGSEEFCGDTPSSTGVGRCR